jgi:hypothetical protein
MTIEVSGVKSEVDDDFDEDFEVEDFDGEDFDDDDDDPDSTDNVGDASVEINVEELIADFEDAGDTISARRKEVRRRLEELAEQRSLEDTYAIDFDDD